MYPHFVLVRYTTVSQAECVDGWLAVQLSDRLWFPCWSSKDMTESAARIIPLIASQERATAALQPANPATSSCNAATTPAPILSHGSSSAPEVHDAAPSDQVIVGLQTRIEELQAAMQVLDARFAATNSSRRRDASDVWPAADAGRLYEVVNALISSQVAMQDRHEIIVRKMQDSHQAIQEKLQERHESTVLKLQDALAASQQQVAASQAHEHTVAVAACCLGAAFLGMLLARARL